MSGFQLGLLNALGLIAFPTLGLFVGVWMDRMKRRPVLILANLIEAAALAAIPAAFVLKILNIYLLYLVSFLMGTCILFFDVAYQSYLTSLVDRGDVIEGNEKLQVSASSAQVAGPAIASGLMKLFGASLSIIADVLGTLVSTALLLTIEKPETLSPSSEQRDFFREMREGIRVITGNSLLWTQAGCTATSNFGSSMFSVALILYAYRVLHFTPANIGIPFSIGAIGFVAGVFLSRRATTTMGLGRTIAIAIALNAFEVVALFAGGPYKEELLGMVLFVAFIGIPIYNINQVSLRQIITPNKLQGRMNATMRTIVWGTQPLGSLVGGILVTILGISSTLVISALIGGGAVFWILLGPIYKLKRQPLPAEN